MIVLEGINLNKRHQELNTNVNEVARRHVNFDEIKTKAEKSDVDKLFKIDLASKTKNMDYIIEVLKSGDNLYISRALKCDWITDDEFAGFVNPQYLERNIFPHMPLKMKKKLLAKLSVGIKNCKRAEEFHHYCMRNRMFKLGMNFLLFTNETFKIEILTLHPHVYNDFNRNEMYVEHFIGNSFLLAEHYLKVISESDRSSVFFKLRYLYSVSEEQYLDLLETYRVKEQYYFHMTSRRLTQNIMKKHKKRVLKDPWLYLNMLQPEVVTKYSTSDDTKLYAVAFLPKECHEFWDTYYYTNYEYFLNIIPLGERFSFIKTIFTEKYPDEKFESDYKFYNYSYYNMMNEHEKEVWALSHIDSKEELHGCGNDYKWYRFVSFEKSFAELKQYVLAASDSDKRTSILKTMVESAKTHEEIAKLLEYYYSRHINEMRDYKRDFVNTLIYNHNVLDFNDECWTALEKIFYSLEVYHEFSEENDYQNNEYRGLSLKYYIIHGKPVKEVIKKYVMSRNITVASLRWDFHQNLDSKKLELIFQYMLSLYTDHVESLLPTKTEENVKQMHVFIEDILDLIVAFDKTLDDMPKLINDYVMSENVLKQFKLHKIFEKLFKPSEFKISDIMHYLKEDASLVVSEFSKIKEYIQEKKPKRNINWLIRKLAIYFSYDIAPKYLNLLESCLNVEGIYLRTARVAVFGIFNLSDEEYKINFLKKYIFSDSKIDHASISRDLLTIQMAICSVACHSRPPLPLSGFLGYIKGDYLQYCIPIFDSYLANLTPNKCLCFVESLLDSPVSVQKHGLRLAFQCFNEENLKDLVLKVWKKTKNVSLRKTLYKGIFNKVDYYHDNLPAQWELFKVLTIITNDLNQEDDEEVFTLLTNHLPPHVFGQHLQSAYIVVSTFPKRTINYERLTRIVREIKFQLELIPKSILLAIMENHIDLMLEKDQIMNTDLKSGHLELINEKWDLINTVIIKDKNMHIVYLISEKTFPKWHKIHNKEYVYRKFYMQYIDDLENKSYENSTESYLETNDLFRTILADMEHTLPPTEIYITAWQLKVNIITRQVLGENLPDIEVTDEETAKLRINETILKFSSLIRDLIIEYIENKKYFLSFQNIIQSKISNAVSKVSGHLNRFFDEYVNTSDICVVLCSVLLEYEVREMYMFVSKFLPTDYDGKYSEEYIGVINKLKSLGDEEIKYLICDIFYSSDYLYRSFMP